MLVGLAGVLPLAVVPASKVGGGAVSEDSLKYLLGFAAGGLLGDVFLHLLPETYQHVRSSSILTSNYNVHNVWRMCLKHLIIHGHGLINAVYAPSSTDILTLVYTQVLNSGGDHVLKCPFLIMMTY